MIALKRSLHAITQITTRRLFMSAPVLEPIYNASKLSRFPLYQRKRDIHHAFSPNTTPTWHSDLFMKDEPLESKEVWLNQFMNNAPSQLDIQAFAVVFHALAQCRQAGAPQRADEYLAKMKALGIHPSAQLYTNAIQAWANSNETGSVVRAERWFNAMKQSGELTTDACHAFLNVCSKGHARKDKVLVENAEKAQDILMFMLDCACMEGSKVYPTTESFNYVLRAWTRCRKNEQIRDKTFNILTQMQTLSQQNDLVKPNIQSYAIAMDALSATAAQKTSKIMKHTGPNDRVALDARVDPMMNGVHEINEIEELLQHVQNLHDSGESNVMPNTVVYNILLSAWSRIAVNPDIDAPLYAEKVLRRMTQRRDSTYGQVKPDYRSYNSVILAWANAKLPNSGERAEFLLNELWDTYIDTRDEDLRPQTSTYNAVLKAWEKDAERMETLLIDLLRNEGKEDFPKADSESFNLVINSLLWTERVHLCHSGEGIRRATAWLHEVIQREKQGTGIASTPELYGAILKTAMSCPSEEILKLCLEVFHNFKSSRYRVDPMAYVYLLRVGLKTFHTQEYDELRTAYLYQVVGECKEDGMLSRCFVQELVNGPTHKLGWTCEESERLVRDVFSEYPIPGSWTRSIQKNDIPNESDFVRTKY